MCVCVGGCVGVCVCVCVCMVASKHGRFGLLCDSDSKFYAVLCSSDSSGSKINAALCSSKCGSIPVLNSIELHYGSLLF